MKAQDVLSMDPTDFLESIASSLRQELLSADQRIHDSDECRSAKDIAVDIHDDAVDVFGKTPFENKLYVGAYNRDRKADEIFQSYMVELLWPTQAAAAEMDLNPDQIATILIHVYKTVYEMDMGEARKPCLVGKNGERYLRVDVSPLGLF